MHFIEQNARRRTIDVIPIHTPYQLGAVMRRVLLKTLPEKEKETTENNSKKEENNVNNLVKSRITQRCCSAKCTLVNM